MRYSKSTLSQRIGVAVARGRRSWGKLVKLPSGNYRASYTGPDGVPYAAPSTFTAKIDAEAWLAGERKLIDLGEWSPPNQRRQKRMRQVLTFGQFAESWLEQRDLKPRTRDHYRKLLDQRLLPEFGKRPLVGLSADDVEDWYRSLGTGTPTLRAHAYSLLRTILGTAVEKGHLTANPCHIRGAGSARRAHKVEPLTLTELEALVAAMPEQHRLMVLFAAWCALRFGELAELRRKDIDVKNSLVKVRRGVVRADGEVIVGTPKSDAGVRDVVIPPHLMPLVKTHLAEHVEPARDALLFPAANGGHLAPSTFYGKAPQRVKNPDTKEVELVGGFGFYRARALAGRPSLHFHDCRHTGAVLAAQTGATLAELMGRLGHSTPAAAMRYQHAARDRDRAIAAAMSAMIEGEK